MMRTSYLQLDICVVTKNFTELKERLSKCGFTREVLDLVFAENSQLPATVVGFQQIIGAAYARQREPVDTGVDGGDHYVHITRWWRSKPETDDVICHFLGVEYEEYARIRFNWVVSKDGETVNNPDFHFINDVQSGKANVDARVDLLETARTKSTTQVKEEWWQTLEVAELLPSEPDNPPPEVDALTQCFSVNARSINLVTYLPRRKTAKWLMQAKCIPKGFIYNRPLVLDSFIGHINETWLPVGIRPNERGRYIEQQFCKWVIDRYPRYCAFDDEAAYHYAVARYAQAFKLNSASLVRHLANLLVDGLTFRGAADRIEDALRNAQLLED